MAGNYDGRVGLLNGLFSAGADIKEFGTSKSLAAPDLRELIALVESCPKPVIAAIDGTCFGGGFELAIGCHYRVASAGAKLGLPEVKLGMLPGAGGTQRLPRLIGVERALNLIVSREPTPAPRFQGSGLLDAIADSTVVAAAVALATRKVDELKGKSPARTRDLEVREPALDAFLGFARTIESGFPNFPAPLAIIEAVELMWGPVSGALRHLFFAEGAAAKIPDVPESTAVREVKEVGVIGAGTMGTGIAINFLNAGIPVTLLEVSQEVLDKGIARDF
jgi:3-hydroxyacyl-CoA dehydrogenase